MHVASLYILTARGIVQLKETGEEMQFGCIILIVTMALRMTGASRNISMLVSLPLHHHPSRPRLSWERGLEILPGAVQAVRDINNDSTILRGYNLQLFVVDNGKDDEIEIVRQFVNLTFLNHIVGVTGIFDPKTVSILTPLVRYKGVLMSAITHGDQLDIPDYSDTFETLSLPSPSAVVRVLLNFMKDMKWQRIGLVTNSNDVYFFSVAENFLQEAKMNDNIIISPYLELFHTTSSAIQEIIKLNAKIIFVSLNAERAIQLLCMVYERGLVWPEYAWIFHSFDVRDFLEQQSVCDKSTANGVFFIDIQPSSDSTQAENITGIISSKYYRQYVSSLSDTTLKYNATLDLRPNGYARLLYDSVWAIATALNKSCHQSTNSTHRKFSRATFKQWIFKIFHIRMLRQVLVSTVHYANSSIIANSFNATTILEKAPSGKLPIMTETPPLVYTAVFGFLIALTTVFTTLVLVLYIYFRKEPEIRATSFTLSLLMFAGCYLNLLYLYLLFYNNHTLDSVDVSRDNALCFSFQWLSGTGISLPIMLATLLVKMLRIYHIFYKTELHLSRYCSDLALSLYVLLILLPDVLINFIWVFVDRYEARFEYQMRGSYVYLKKVCTNKYLGQLFGILSIYVLILVLVLTIMAVITRKIRLQHFKDTKKVNILLFVLCIGTVMVYAYWLLLQIVNTKRYISNLPAQVGHLVLIVSFQSLLFVPKVLPPLWRHIENP